MKPTPLFVDIETICSQNPAFIAKIAAANPAPVEADFVAKLDSRFTDPVKIAADKEAKAAKSKADFAAAVIANKSAIDTAHRKTALDGLRGHVISFAFALGDGLVGGVKPDAYDRSELLSTCTDFAIEGEMRDNYRLFINSERLFLIDAFEMIATAISLLPPVGSGGLAGADWWPDVAGPSRKVVVVAQNGRRFDIRFLIQRCMVLKIVPPAWLVDAWKSRRGSDDRLFDTAEIIGSTDSSKVFGYSLETLCDVFGIPDEDETHGGMVYDMWLADEVDRIWTYNVSDVEKLRAIYKRATFDFDDLISRAVGEIFGEPHQPDDAKPVRAVPKPAGGLPRPKKVAAT